MHPRHFMLQLQIQKWYVLEDSYWPDLESPLLDDLHLLPVLLDKSKVGYCYSMPFYLLLTFYC